MAEQPRPVPASPAPALLGAETPGAATEIGPVAAGVAKEARGTIRIAPAVLIELIELTVRDVPGVVGIGARRGMDRIVPSAGGAATDERPRPAPAAKTYERGGVRVRITADRVDADVSIRVRPAANIMELSRTIQRRVGLAVGRMLGMTVSEVNVYVPGIDSDRNGKG